MACSVPSRVLAMGAIASFGLAVLTPGTLAQQQERQIERAVRQAETEYTYRTKVDSSLGVTERSMFEVGGFANFTAIFLTDSTDNYRRLFQPEVVLYGRAVVDGAHTFFGRTRFRYRDFSPGDSFDGRGDQWSEPFLDRYWYEFDLKRAIESSKGVTPDGNINVRVGRQFTDFGGGLSVSEVLYAARPVITIGRVDIEGLAGVTPTDRSIIDFDASRKDYDSDTERGFFGGLLRYNTVAGGEIYAYALHMPDWNSNNTPRVPIGIPVDFDYEATYFGIGAEGSFTSQLLYSAEFVYEIGTSQSDPLRGPQTEEDISAFAGRASLTYLFRDPGRSSISLETVFASGDDDRLVSTDTVGGNESGSNDNAFNSLGFASTGLAFAPSVSNIFLVRAGGKTFPFADNEALEGFQVGVDLTLFNKFDADAPIEEPTSNSMFLGFESDFYVNYQVTSDFSIIARLGLFFPGDAIETTSATRSFVFIGATLAF